MPSDIYYGLIKLFIPYTGANGSATLTDTSAAYVRHTVDLVVRGLRVVL